MEPSGIEALKKLANMGYRFTVNGENVKARYEGQGAPNPAQARLLLEVVKAHKDSVRRFLEKKRPSLPERILSCQECPWYELNPWTHHPELGAWCRHHMDHLLIDNPQCIGYRRGQLPERATS